jgi:hypothetical protein
VDTSSMTRPLYWCPHLARDRKGLWWPCLTTVEVKQTYCADHALGGRLDSEPDLGAHVIPFGVNVIPFPSQAPASDLAMRDHGTEDEDAGVAAPEGFGPGGEFSPPLPLGRDAPGPVPDQVAVDPDLSLEEDGGHSTPRAESQMPPVGVEPPVAGASQGEEALVIGLEEPDGRSDASPSAG